MSKKVYIDFELRYKEAVKNLDEMQKEYTKLEKKVQKYEKQVEKAEKKQGDFGKTLDKVTGGAVTKFKDFTSGIKSATLGFKGLKAALMATGIGALVVLLGSLTAAFTQSEEGQEKLQRGLAALGAVVKNTMDLLSDLGNTIISAFKVVGNAVTGRFDKLSESTAELAVNVGKTGNAIKNFVKDTVSEVKAIDQVTKARQKARRIERDLQVERAKANRDINELRLKAEDRERFSASERIKMLREAQAIEEEITNKEIEATRLLVEAQKDEMALGKNTIEDKEKLAELEAKLINLDTKRLRSQRLLQTQITTATNQEKAEKQKEIDEFNKEYVFLPGVGFVTRESVEQMRKNGEEVDKILEDFEKRKEEERAETEAQKLELEKQRKLAELDEFNATEAQKAEIRLYYNDLIKSAEDKDAQDAVKREEILQKQKIAIISQTFGTLANILGKNSQAGKAFAVAQALTNTYLGVTEVLDNETTLPEPFATIQKVTSIAGVLATGFQAVKSIKSVDPKGGGAATTITAAGVGQATSQAPSFNVVGAGVTNQLADVIAGQAGQPTRAYVVSNDVSTAQELDRNIIEGASIG
jgi:DNA repair exonuclease SbcCD ATPase subunit